MSFFKNTKSNVTSFDDNTSDNDSSDDNTSDESGDESNELNESGDELPVQEDTVKIDIDPNVITVFGNKKGSKTNTYIVGLNVTDEIRKKYLKALRVRYACGGTIKMILYNDIDQIAINLNGDQIQNVKTFLLKEKVQQPINIKSIE